PFLPTVLHLDRLYFFQPKTQTQKLKLKTGASDATNLHFVKRLSRHFLGRAGMRNSGYYTSHSGLALSDRGQAHTHLAISCGRAAGTKSIPGRNEDSASGRGAAL